MAILDQGVPGRYGKYGGINPTGTPVVEPTTKQPEAIIPNDPRRPRRSDEERQDREPRKLLRPERGVPPVHGGADASEPAPAATPPAVDPSAATEPEPAPYSGYNAPGALDTVEGRMNTMLSKDSEYNQLAETKGLQLAQQRGLLNSSMAAGAARASAMEAALPIAQQDADWMNKNRMQADTMAQERGLETYEQEMLSWDQYLKGVADINMQDMDATQKQAAVQNLRDNYFAGSGISASLRNVTIKDGVVNYGEGSAAPTASGQASSSAPTGTSTPAMSPISSSAVNNPNDLLSYQSKSAMNETQRYVFEQQYGTGVEPPQVKAVFNAYSDADVRSGSPKSSATKAVSLLQNMAVILKNNGFDIRYASKGAIEDPFKGADAGIAKQILAKIPEFNALIESANPSGIIA